MPEQEKVVKTIEGLKELRSHFRAMAGIASSNQARAGHIESARIIDDAITLLKTQDSDETRLVRHYSRPNVYADLWLHCEKCGGRVDDRYKPKFCPECGRKVNWE